MALQSLPPSVSRYTRSQRREIASALAAVKRQWARMDPADFTWSWAAVLPLVVQIVATAQGRLLEDVPAYVTDALADTGQRVPDLRWEPNLAGMVGYAGTGVTLSDTLAGTVPRAKALVADGMAARSALLNTGNWLAHVLATVLSDTARGGEQLAMKSRGVQYYARALSPPTCGRCIILAGKISRSREAFLRHPDCDCRHVPIAGGPELAIFENNDALLADPRSYLGGLDERELARALGSKANARAFLDGADVNQLVNAYRRTGSVSKVTTYGRQVLATTEGTTRRGVAYSSMRRADYIRAAGEQKVGRYTSTRAPRIMPATIYEIAGSEAEARRLLDLYGWILPGR